MKYRLRALALALLLGITSTVSAFAAPPAIPQDEPMRGVWVTTVYNIDFPTAPTTSSVQLQREIDAAIDNIAAYGLNTIFLQVRPSADAIYPSDYFPWSAWLTGEQGQQPSNGFDPLAYWVEQAHAHDLQLHAWLNPYRITKKGQTEFDALTNDHPAKQHPEWVMEYDGQFYFNPALPSVQAYTVDAAVEIVENYDVDGIHMDDYFYPSPDFPDADSFARYGGSFTDIADWRRDNVNQLVEQLDTALHQADPEIAFGISPSGIWANRTTNARGSDTAGYEHYTSSFADSLHWIANGTVDYIMPQIYWEIGKEVADFAVLSSWWERQVLGSDVELYIGMAAYRIDPASTDVWQTSAPLFEGLEYLTALPTCAGEVFFSYNSLTGGVGDALGDWYAERDAQVPMPELPQGDQNTLMLEDSAHSRTFLQVVELFLLAMIR